ncbi:YfcC family protein [Ralstonia sp. A12]|uniref:YfcC family protein n=1 Tax=Ralstonia sp. A12 TaxID=1217052 RepID=UPI0006946BF3|nr:SLC13 family permease [Ralstonia sp. A12]
MSATLETERVETQRPHAGFMHPIVMMLWVIFAAICMTYLVDAGKFERKGKLVVPGTYQLVPKVAGLPELASPMPHKSTPAEAHAASVVGAVMAIPQGLIKSAPLVFMVMFVGGMFGVMRRTGVIDAGIDRLLQITGGNVYRLAPAVMIVLGLGSSFLGLISEYLVVIPIVVAMARRLGLNELYGLALVTIAAKIGYIASVTNPLALPIAQPLAGVPLFSGIDLRLAVFVVFMAIGIGYWLWRVRRSGLVTTYVPTEQARLSRRHVAVLLVLLASSVMMIVGTRLWSWHNVELAAFYIIMAVAIALAGRLDSRVASEAFVDGMKGMMLAGLLIGLASAVELILQNSLVLDTIIHSLTRLTQDSARPVVAGGIMVMEMILDVFMPSLSGKAAVSMPILAPIAHLSGVSGQTCVLAFLMGGGLMNMVTPTSGMLLAYLATARVNYGQWVAFVFPLFATLFVLSLLALGVAVEIGY